MIDKIGIHAHKHIKSAAIGDGAVIFDPVTQTINYRKYTAVGKLASGEVDQSIVVRGVHIHGAIVSDLPVIGYSIVITANHIKCAADVNRHHCSCLNRHGTCRGNHGIVDDRESVGRTRYIRYHYHITQ